MDRHFEQLAKIRDSALKKGAFSAATNAEVARGKVAGYYIDRKLIKTGKIDDLDREQLMNKLTKIITENSKIIEGASTEEKPRKLLSKDSVDEIKPKEPKAQIKILKSTQKLDKAKTSQ